MVDETVAGDNKRLRMEVQNLSSSASIRSSVADTGPPEVHQVATRIATASASAPPEDVEEGELLSGDEEHEAHSPADAWKLNLPTAAATTTTTSSPAFASEPAKGSGAPGRHSRRSTVSEEGELAYSDGHVSPPPDGESARSAACATASSARPSGGARSPPNAGGFIKSAQSPGVSTHALPLNDTISRPVDSDSSKKQEALHDKQSSRPKYVFKVKASFDHTNPPSAESFMYSFLSF